MTLAEIFKLIDDLTPQQKQTVKRYLDNQEQDALWQNIQAILQTAPQTHLIHNTMDVDRLLEVTQAMWAGLSNAEIELIIQSMNEEVVKAEAD